MSETLCVCGHAEQQYISDILGLIDHGDPQIRGATAILCGAIIQAALTKTRYNIHTWLAGVQSATGLCVCGGHAESFSLKWIPLTRLCSPGNPLSLVDLVPLLQKTLKDESSVTCKMACAAVRVCWLCVGYDSGLCPVCVWSVTLFLPLWAAALPHDGVQQLPERAGPAAAHQPAASEGLVLLAGPHRAAGDDG